MICSLIYILLKTQQRSQQLFRIHTHKDDFLITEYLTPECLKLLLHDDNRKVTL